MISLLFIISLTIEKLNLSWLRLHNARSEAAELAV